MKTKTINLYSFNELNEETQKKAIAFLTDINTQHNWWDLTTDEMNEELTKLGFIGSKIYFSGFSSQGDGACFICDSIDFNLFQGGKYKDLDITANIEHRWRYYFATSTTVNLEGEVTDEQYSEIEQAIKDEREEIGNRFYKRLEDEHYYLISDEAIKETITANNYLFNEDGEIDHE